MAFLRQGMAKTSNRITPMLDIGRGITTMYRKEPKTKEFAPPINGGEPDKGKSKGGTYFPIYVALGMIGMSLAFGLHSVKQQVLHAPAVRVKKSRRETMSEVDEPELVARESHNFINKSFFRKLAHVQDSEKPMENTIHANPREAPVESLKTVEVNPEEVEDLGR